MKKYVKPELEKLLAMTEDVMTTSITLMNTGADLDNVDAPDGVIDITF